MNQAVLELLGDAVARARERAPRTAALRHDLDHLVGAWSARDADELDAALRAQRRTRSTSAA